MSRFIQGLCGLLVVGLLAVPAAPAADRVTTGPLAEYVNKKDDAFKWSIRRKGQIAGSTYVEIVMTSQNWKGTTWKHRMLILRPAQVASPHEAVLLINGGDWDPKLELPAKPDEKIEGGVLLQVAAAAGTAKALVALVFQVPHQPIFDGKVEDEIIAHTFAQYLETKDPEWPALLPMVKSAVRAMDTVQEVAQQEWKQEITNFVVTGASKRGWTTWLTAAVDPRVNAIAPMVIDVLNMPEQMDHQLATWGKYSDQIEDYTKLGIQGKAATEEGKALNAIVDPYAYRDVLTMPKLMLLGTNDEYWTLDALNVYWDDLKGEKFVVYCPNKGHDLNDPPRLLSSIAALYRHAAGEDKMPKFTWEVDESADKVTLKMKGDPKPQFVKVWSAKSDTKDFRKSTWGPTFVEATGDEYVYELPLAETVGNVAFYGEATFKVGADKSKTVFESTNMTIAQGQKAAAEPAEKEPEAAAAAAGK